MFMEKRCVMISQCQNTATSRCIAYAEYNLDPIYQEIDVTELKTFTYQMSRVFFEKFNSF